jgi:hypothetical protein
MAKCNICGRNAIYAKPYFIGSKDAFGFGKFEGAAVVGICGECAKPYLKKQINKNLLGAVAAFAVGLFFLAITLTKGINIWVIAFMISCFGGSIKFFLAYKTISVNNVPVTKDMIDDEIVTKVLENSRQVDKDIILNWEVLNTKRYATASDFSDPVFIAEIRTPFKVGINGKIELDNIMNISEYARFILPWFGSDKSLDKQGIELIKQAVGTYQNEMRK